MYEFCGRVDADGQPEAWFVLEDGVVVGDAGTHGPPNENGDVEIGYGLVEAARGRGLSFEFVPALAHRSWSDRGCAESSPGRCWPTTSRRDARSSAPGSGSSAKPAA